MVHFKKLLNYSEFNLFPEMFLGISIVFLVLFGSYVSNYYNRPLIYKTTVKLCILVLFLTLSLVINDFIFYYNQSVSFNSKIITDELSFLIKVLILLFSMVYLLIIQQSLSDQRINNFEYPVIVLVAVLGLLMLTSSNDLITAYIAIELQSLSFYILAAFKRTSGYSLNAGLKYFLIGALSSSLFLLGSSLVYGLTGSTNFEVYYYMFSFFSDDPIVVNRDCLLKGGMQPYFFSTGNEYVITDPFSPDFFCTNLYKTLFGFCGLSLELFNKTPFTIPEILSLDKVSFKKIFGNILTQDFLLDLKDYSDSSFFVGLFVFNTILPSWEFFEAYYFTKDYIFELVYLVNFIMYFDFLYEGIRLSDNLYSLDDIISLAIGELKLDGYDRAKSYTQFFTTPSDNVGFFEFIVDYVNQLNRGFLKLLEVNSLNFLEELLEKNDFDLCKVIEMSPNNPIELQTIRFALNQLVLVDSEFHLDSIDNLSISYKPLENILSNPKDSGLLEIYQSKYLKAHSNFLKTKEFYFFDFWPYLSIGKYKIMNFALILIFMSLCLKLAAAPFHLWSPDVYENSPTFSTVFFSTLPKLGIFTLFVRLFYHSFYGLFEEFRYYFIIVAILSIIIGSFVGLEQRKLKSLLVYSSIGHVGYLMLSFSTGTGEGLSMSIAYLIVYLCSSLCIWSIFLFTRLKNVYNKFNKDLTDIVLLRKSNSTLALCFGIVLFSFAGFPPMVGFLTKVNIFSSTIGSSIYYFSIIGVLCSVISTFYYIRLVKIMYFENVKVGKLYYPIKTFNVFIISLVTYLLIFLFINPVVFYLIVIYMSMGWNF